MRLSLFLFLSFILISVANVFALNKSTLEQLCVEGNYIKADSLLSPEDLIGTEGKIKSELDNTYIMLGGEVFLNTANKQELNRLIQMVSVKYAEDSLHWPSLKLLTIYSLLINDRFEEAENACVLLASDKAIAASYPLVNYLAYATLTDLLIEQENYQYSNRLVNFLDTKAAEIFENNHRFFAENHERKIKLAIWQGNIPEAENYMQSLELHFKDKSTQQTLDHATYLLLQGKLFLIKGEPAVCAANIKIAHSILSGKVHKNHKLYTQYRLLYIELSNFIGNYGKSLRQINEVDNSSILDSEDLFLFRHELALLYSLSGQYLEAEKIIANSSFPKFFNKNGIASFRHQLLQLSIKQNTVKNDLTSDYRQLLDVIKSTLSINHYLYIEGSIQYAHYLYQIGHYDSAILAYKETVEGIKGYYHSVHPYYITVQENLALVNWAKGDKKKALKYFTETSNDFNYQYNKYFAFLSEKEKNIFYSKIRVFYDKFYAFMLEEHKHMPQLIGMAYDYRLANKAILFNSTQELKNAIYTGNDSILINKYYEWNGLRENLAKVYKLMAEGIHVEQKLVDELEEKTQNLEEYIQLKASINEIHGGRMKKEILWHDVASYLTKKEAAVEVIRINKFRPDSGGYFTDRISYAFLQISKSTRNRPGIIVIENGNELENKQIKYYRNAIRFKIQDAFSYSKFIAPLLSDKNMENISTIYFSPDGIYNKLNLNTLYSKADTSFVLNKYRIRLLTNLKDVITVKQENKIQKFPETSVLLGYPNFYTTSIQEINPEKNDQQYIYESSYRSAKSNEIEELPGTKIEIETIGSLLTDSLKNHKVMSLLSKDASEENLKKIKMPGIFHVATHGFFNESQSMTKHTSDTTGIKDMYQENPLMLCGILLSGAGFARENKMLSYELKSLSEGKTYEDGILTAYEAMNLDLRGLQVAILSACETGLGKIQSGEGVYGFQRALQTAGAKTIIMSLWKVDDLATKKLMIYFYDAWIKTGDRVRAFEFAQKKIKEEFKSPVYWGAFIMIG